MRFTMWVLDQMDTGGTTANFAKICWDDINNGCASGRYTSVEWVHHFNEKHKEKADILMDMFLTAYVEFMKEKKKIV